MIRLLAPILLFSNFILAQSSENIIYYKDKRGYEEVSRGPYKLVISKVNDSVTSHIFSKVRGKRKIWEKYYLGKQPFGVWIEYDKKGKVLSKKDYNFILKYGELIPDKAFTLKELGISQKNDPNSLTIIKHLSQEFNYPEEAIANGYEGTVLMQFTIDKTGEINNIRVLKGVHLLLDMKCYKIIRSLKNIKPYQFNGEKVMTYYTLPIKFKLVSD